MTVSNPRFQGTDDQPVQGRIKDASGGVNSRTNSADIADNQFEILYNVDIGVPGQTSCMPGSVLIGNDVGDASPLALHNFQIQGAGETDQLLMFETITLWKWTGSGSWGSLKADFPAGATKTGMISAKESGLTPDDVVIIQDGVNQAWRLDSDGNIEALGTTAGTASDSPPLSVVMCWYGNRVWVLKNDLLYFSSAYPAAYATAFDTVSDSFRIPVGPECALIPTRDTGIVVMGEREIWGIAPSIIPDPTADKPQPLITNHGIVSKGAFVNAGDDIYYFARDGFRSIKRTQQDKLSGGPELPISYNLKTEYEAINFKYIANLTMEYFDSKIFIAVPTGATTFDTWIYYPSSGGFSIKTGIAPTCWAKYRVDSAGDEVEERLYYGKAGKGKVYRAWYGFNDEGTTTANGTAINYQEESKSHDGGQPMIKKQGGELTIRAESGGNYDLSVYAQFDDAEYNLLGTLNLAGNTPVLPVNLPFTLANQNIVFKKFHLDRYGEWYNCQVKLIHNATKSSGLTVLDRQLLTYAKEYIHEEES